MFPLSFSFGRISSMVLSRSLAGCRIGGFCFKGEGFFFIGASPRSEALPSSLEVAWRP